MLVKYRFIPLLNHDQVVLIIVWITMGITLWKSTADASDTVCVAICKGQTFAEVGWGMGRRRGGALFAYSFTLTIAVFGALGDLDSLGSPSILERGYPLPRSYWSCTDTCTASRDSRRHTPHPASA